MYMDRINGLLSENARFAELCAQCHIKFIGPSAEVIRRMGDKDEARRTMRAAGVPVVPGCDLVENVEQLRAEAEKIGYPLLIKARSGGGGRGIRRVDGPEELEHAFLSATAEAESAFGDGAVYMEKLMEDVKHVEVQLLCDSCGNVITLGERECSMQRHHQKLIEESPSPAVDEKLRAEMLDAARRAQERLPRESGARDYVDEDQYWVWGLFYYNPNDRRTMINDRTGMGMGLNMARPAGKIVMGICAALLFLLLPAMSGWFIVMDFTPREARIEDGTLCFEHLTEKYEIPLGDISSLELLDDLPSSRRVAGTGMDTLCEGRFDVEGYENVRISLDPQQDCYIVVLTGEGLTRIFNLMSEAETEEFYAEIEAALKS